MAMTQKRAARLTGYEVRLLSGEPGHVQFGAFEDGKLVAEAGGVVEWLALENLVEQVFQMHSRRVFERSGWRCARCRRAYRLHIHHRRYRSHGGTHEIENLEPLCWKCHRLVHQIERSQ